MADVFQTDPAEQPLEDKNYLEELVGEGKKFSDPEKLARAKVESDRFIAQLLKEQDEMRKALEKRNNEEEFLTKLEQITKPRQPEVPEPTRNDPLTERPQIPLDEIEKIIEQREAKKTAEQNLNTVVSRLEQAYGPDYRSRVQTQATALGVGTEFLTDIAAKNPQAFYKLMGLDEQKTQAPGFAPPPRSSVQSFAPNTGNKKNYNYWKAQRAEKGEGWYFQKSTQREIWDSVRTMGEQEFYKE